MSDEILVGGLTKEQRADIRALAEWCHREEMTTLSKESANEIRRLRDEFAMAERLSDFDDFECNYPVKIAVYLAGPKPDGENYAAILEWENTWRSKLKYLRADSMLKAREVKHEP